MEGEKERGREEGRKGKEGRGRKGRRRRRGNVAFHHLLLSNLTTGLKCMIFIHKTLTNLTKLLWRLRRSRRHLHVSVSAYQHHRMFTTILNWGILSMSTRGKMPAILLLMLTDINWQNFDLACTYHNESFQLFNSVDIHRKCGILRKWKHIFLLHARYVPNVARRSIILWDQCKKKYYIEDRPADDRRLKWKKKSKMAISPQGVVRSTSYLVLEWGFRGRWIEWRYFQLDQNSVDM